jgi:hypothetical protein
MTAAAYPDRFDIGRIIVRAFDIIRHNLLQLVALTLILYGLPRLGASLLGAMTDAMPAFPGAIFSMTRGVYWLAAILGYCALQPAVYRVAAAELNGRQTNIVENLRTGLAFLLPVLGLLIIACIGVVVGLFCLVVPGIFLMVIWAVAVPALVTERLSIGNALKRSAALTEGYRWQVFGLGVIVVVATILANIVVSIPGGIIGAIVPFEPVRHAAHSLTEDLFKIVTTLISAVMTISLYYELRSVKEAAEPEDLAELI